MKLKKYLLPCVLAACGFASSAFAQDDDTAFGTVRESRESDPASLAQFVKSKGMITIQEKGGNLMLSGDIRAEWDHVRSHNGHHHRNRLRGSKSGHHVQGERPILPQPTNEFAVEANLMFDYRADRSWGKMQLQFDNAAGFRERLVKDESGYPLVNKKNTLFGSGTLNKIVLRKAYMGYNLCECGTSRLDIEVGRRRLYDVFDSKIQFYNFFDGLLLRYANSYEGICDLQLKLAAFVIDQRVNHFGYAGELGLLNIGDEGLDFKYSYNHIDKEGVNRYNYKHPQGARFNISQFLLAYNFSPDVLRYKTQLYGAYLLNHSANRHNWTHRKKENDAYYVGFRVGEPKRQGDWAFEANYQWVQPQAIEESCVRGIGRDNPRNISVYLNKRFGFANYKGYELNAVYNVTDNLSMEVDFTRVHQCTKRVGGDHRAWVLTLESIYAF